MNLPLDYLLRKFINFESIRGAIGTATPEDLLEHLLSNNYCIVHTGDTFLLLDKERKSCHVNYLLSAIEDTNEALYRAASVAAAFVPYKETTWEDL